MKSLIEAALEHFEKDQLAYLQYWWNRVNEEYSKTGVKGIHITPEEYESILAYKPKNIIYDIVSPMYPITEHNYLLGYKVTVDYENPSN